MERIAECLTYFATEHARENNLFFLPGAPLVVAKDESELMGSLTNEEQARRAALAEKLFRQYGVKGLDLQFIEEVEQAEHE